jgi:hypothetical protein
MQLLLLRKNLCCYFRILIGCYGAWGSVVRTALLVGRSWDRSPVVSLGIFSEGTDETMCPGIDSASKKNEYQDNRGGEGGRCVRVTTLPPS